MEPIFRNIYSFLIPLPNNPLRSLNCYVIKATDGGRNLLIDSGFRRIECQDALSAGIKELGIDPEQTDVFFTHLHSDHSGNAAELQAMGCRLMLSKIDMDYLANRDIEESRRRMVAEGISPAELRIVIDNNPALLYGPGPYKAEPISAGRVLEYGGFHLECISTPGHTPGHMCLYDRDNQLMFLGDHVLFDITPNICFWSGVENSLEDYLESLRAIESLPITLALPAHRGTGHLTVAQRAKQLIAHHTQRLAEAESIIRAKPGLSAYDIAGEMTWQIRCKNWDKFPPAQKWFALGEAIAHMDKLCIDGRIQRRTDDNGHVFYYPV